MFNYYHIDQMVGAPGTFRSLVEKLLPVATLFLGILINRSLGRSDKRMRDRKTTKDLMTEIELLDEPMKKQAQAVDDLVNSLKERVFTSPRYTSVQSLRLDRLAVLDRSSVVDHLERNLGSRKSALDQANRLFLGCDVIAGRHKQLQEVVESYRDRSSAAFERWKAATERLRRAQANMMAEMVRAGRNPLKDDLVGGIGKLTEATNFEGKDLFTILDEVHLPVVTVCSKNMKDPRSQELVAINAEAHDAILAVELEKGYAISKLEQVKDGMVKQYDKLKELIETIKA